MKKLFLTIFAFLFFNTASAAETIQVIWPFAPGSTQAVMFRNLVDSANTQQTKYNFIFVNKPGAGGTVAAKYVESASTLSILASTTSFYSRPMMYYESHKAENFVLTNTVCLDAPIAIFSKRYNNFAEFENKEITIGINPGSVTQLVTQTIIRDNPKFKFKEIPYKGTIEASIDMIAQRIDASVELLATGALARMPEGVSTLGITGSKSIKNVPSLSSLGVKGLEKLTNNYFIFVHMSASSDFKKEISDIFNKSINEKVKDGCSNENGVTQSLNFINSDAVHKTNMQNWQRFTQGIVKQ
jgi:tripartite-type tricarboxylate transporter receptor subunit TctC